jgi:triacylglycerol lipase
MADTDPQSTPKLAQPIVLLHGLTGFERFKEICLGGPEYFRGIRPHFEASGNRVLEPKLSPMASTAKRAAELREQIHREVGSEPVHILAHSLGGLDARYWISKLGGAEHVRTLTTIGTPHRGTTFANLFPHEAERRLRPLFQRIGLDLGAFQDLTVETCRQFNDDVVDVPGVRYFSVAGVCEKPILGIEWWLPAKIVGRAEGPNDGIVSVASAAWGETNQVWDADHLNLVNWPNRKLRRQGLWRDRTADYGGLLQQIAET